MHSQQTSRTFPRGTVSIVMGLNEIASAIAVSLHRAGHAVVMHHDPALPVIRRGMAFYDAAFACPATVAGISAVSTCTLADARRAVTSRNNVVVSRLDFSELLLLGDIAVLVDARMHKHEVRPDLRHLARLSVGVGPGFGIGLNCDVAIETKPSRAGRIICSGQTENADGISRKLGGAGRERFVYSETAGHWRTALDVGKRVFKGFPVGRLGATPILAPLDGVLRGIARDGIDVPAGVKLIEIDPRGRRAQWTGIDDRGRVIAEATTEAIEGAWQRLAQKPGLTLVR